MVAHRLAGLVSAVRLHGRRRIGQPAQPLAQVLDRPAGWLGTSGFAVSHAGPPDCRCMPSQVAVGRPALGDGSQEGDWLLASRLEGWPPAVGQTASLL